MEKQVVKKQKLNTPNTQTQKPANKFYKNIEELKKFATENGYEVSTKENSKKIFISKTTKDNEISELVLIPLGVDNWIVECRTLLQVENKETKKKTNVQKTFNVFRNYSLRTMKDVIKLYA